MTLTASSSTLAYVGSRTTAAREGRGRGIEVYDVGPDGEGWTLLQTVELDNPTFLATDRTRRFLYAVHGDHSHVSAYRIDPASGLLTALGPAPHRTDRRQAAPGKLSYGPVPSVATREFAGPRHLAFHPHLPYAYTIDELRSTVTCYHWDAGRGALRALQILAGTEPTTTGDSRGAEIAVSPDGRFVYASNRGGAGDTSPGGPEPDTIGVFKVSAKTGLLRPVGWTSTGGIRPRFFCLSPDGRKLYAANERSHTIVTYDVDAVSGGLRPTGRVVHTGSPVCVLFLRRDS